LAKNSKSLASVVMALGTPGFERTTLACLNATCGVEHYSLYRLRKGEPRFLGGDSINGAHAMRVTKAFEKWPQRSYIELHEADRTARQSRSTVLMRGGMEETADPPLQQALHYYGIGDRVMMCGRAADDLYVLALLKSRSAGQFDERELHDLGANAELLLSSCAKHAELYWDRQRTVSHFASVEVIEANLRASDWKLSERDLQVSARVLHGISTYGIALDLGLTEETIATYRKRLYARLKIGGRHELMQRYLKLL